LRLLSGEYTLGAGAGIFLVGTSNLSFALPNEYLLSVLTWD
tara:strand:- start:657 stop:779 length:123 start_codon:yes stop_codon:yes gene_type:complete